MCEETSQGWRENHPKDVEVTVLSAYTKLGSVPVPTSQTRKPLQFSECEVEDSCLNSEE